ncbi:MAG: carbohydrate binding domain-containing protein [Candidatus Methylacidiphilales bacterium]
MLRILRPLLATAIAFPLAHLGTASLRANSQLPLINGNFEEGLKGWTLKAPDGTEPATVSPEAASLGQKGLRVTNLAEGQKFELVSDPLPVTAGKTYTVSFWSGGGGEKPGSVSIKMVFSGPKSSNQTMEVLPPDMAQIRKWPGAECSGSIYFGNDLLAAAAPAGATQLTIHIIPKRGSSVGTSVDFDDFTVTELAPPVAATPRDPMLGNPVPPTDPALLQSMLDEIRKDPTRGKTPPRIVLKLDDLKPIKGGGIHQRWLKVAEFAAKKNIKVSFGIIAGTMDTDAPAFFSWVKEKHAAGHIEFWHHGWDHAGDGKIMEFSGQPYDHQKDHMTRANALAKEKLGFAFASFGAPFNATDDVTVRVLQEDPDIKVWMYGKPRTPAGKIVLRRSGAVNLEAPTIIANYGAFIVGYAHNRGAEYFVLQGHPAGWGDDRYAEFVKIVEFLIEQKADFVLPRDFISNPPKAAPQPGEDAATEKPGAKGD